MKRIEVRVDEVNYPLLQFVAQVDNMPVASWIVTAAMRAAHAHPAAKVQAKQYAADRKAAEKARLADIKSAERERIARLKAQLSDARAEAKAAEKAKLAAAKEAQKHEDKMAAVMQNIEDNGRKHGEHAQDANLRYSLANIPGFAEWYAKRPK